MKKPTDDRVSRYPAYLRGMATNRYGGNQLQSERGLKGGTYGPASAGRVYSEEERRQHEKRLREQGDLQ